MIPRKIHQIWIGSGKPPDFLGSWRDLNPSFEYFLWKDRELSDLKITNQTLWDAFKRETDRGWLGLADIARVEIIYQFGGIHIDADIEALRPLEGDFLNEDFFTVYVSEKQRGERVNSAVMGSVAGHLILKSMIDSLAEERKVRKPVWNFTGPGLFTRCVADYPEKIRILPSYYFEPDFFEGEAYKGDFKPFGYHYWAGTKRIYGKI